MRVLRKMFLLSLLLIFTAAGSAQAGARDEYPEYDAWLELSPAVVDLGLPVPDQSGDGEYWELENALLIMFQCKQKGQKWRVELTGATDFISGSNSIRLNRMEWKAGSGDYESLRRPGRVFVLAQSTDYPGNETGLHTLFLSFRLNLFKEEPAGDYSSLVKVTMYFW